MMFGFEVYKCFTRSQHLHRLEKDYVVEDKLVLFSFIFSVVFVCFFLMFYLLDKTI